MYLNLCKDLLRHLGHDVISCFTLRTQTIVFSLTESHASFCSLVTKGQMSYVVSHLEAQDVQHGGLVMVPRSDVPGDKLVRSKQTVELCRGLGAAEFLESVTLAREPQKGSRVLAESNTQHGCQRRSTLFSELRRSTDRTLIVASDLKVLITAHSLPSDVHSFTIHVIVIHSAVYQF